ncbi:MAG TPA: hypothetical protein VMB52_06000 [Verrucomicrobiae bacterium]|nr:hypothetical protein [Verrucomicrobiae bacterium]
MTHEDFRRSLAPAPLLVTPEELAESQLFRELAIPIGPGDFPDIRDAQLYIRRDGLIVNAEGWHHPEGRLVGEVIYAPDANGDREIFGKQFRKLSLYPGTYDPVPYAQRGALFGAYDPALDQTAVNPHFAKYKQIFDRADFAAYLSGEEVFRRLIPRLAAEGNMVIDDIASIDRILGLDLSSVGKGFTGAPSFGQLDQLHDLDIIFSGSLEENLAIAKAMRATVRDNPQRRLTEGGKGWNIRFFNDRKTLICSFFTYKNPEDAPLREFTMEVVEPDVVIEGAVFNDMHTMYTPTVLGIDRARLLTAGDRQIDAQINEPLQLIAYHTATRGECFEGDKVRARGALVQITTPTSQHMGVCVIEREGIRNLTPTWQGFYEDDGVTV